MADLPVESMTTGGLLWFTDLTITDPYYALPLLTAATFLASLEVTILVLTLTMPFNYTIWERFQPFWR